MSDVVLFSWIEFPLVFSFCLLLKKQGDMFTVSYPVCAHTEQKEKRSKSELSLIQPLLCCMKHFLSGRLTASVSDGRTQAQMLVSEVLSTGLVDFSLTKRVKLKRS